MLAPLSLGRQWQLATSESTDTERAEASYRDGVLTVATYEIPKWWISIFIAY